MIYGVSARRIPTRPALVCMTFQAFRLKLGTAYFRYEFVIAAVHAKAINAFVVPEGTGRGINGDIDTDSGTLKKACRKTQRAIAF
jgi:hypothetical protein